MSRLHHKHELILKDKVNRIALKQLERLYGFDVRLYRSQKNVYSDVYGVESGDESEIKKNFFVLITGQSFSPVSISNVGELQEGWLYTSDPTEIFTGDTIEVVREDKSAFKFKVVSKEGIGTTETVMFRWKIAALGEDNIK